MEFTQNQQLRDRLLSNKLMDVGRCNSILASRLTDTAKTFNDLCAEYLRLM